MSTGIARITPYTPPLFAADDTLEIPQLVETGPEIPQLDPPFCDARCHWYLLIRVVPTSEEVGYYYWLERTGTEQSFPPQYVEGWSGVGAPNNGCDAGWLARVQAAANAFVPGDHQEVVSWTWQPGQSTIGPPGCPSTGPCESGPPVAACAFLTDPNAQSGACPDGYTYDTFTESCKILQLPNLPPCPLRSCYTYAPKCDCPPGEYVANAPTDNGCLVGDSLDTQPGGCPDCCIPHTTPLPPPCVCLLGNESCCCNDGRTVNCQKPYLLDADQCSCFCPCERNRVNV